MEKIILDTLGKISRDLYQLNNLSHCSLGGEVGNLLFQFEYNFRLSNTIPKDFSSAVENVIAGSTLLNNYHFLSGKTGISWFYTFLFKNDILKKADWEDLKADKIQLTRYLKYELQRGNYDFLYGATGMIYYLLYEDAKIYEDLIAEYFTVLLSLCTKSELKMLPHYDLQRNTSNNEKVDIGLAHGIISVLKCCIECIEFNIASELAKALAEKIFIFLINHKNENIQYSYFPNSITKTVNYIKDSRLAWCYGDINIGFILLQGAKLTGNKDAERLAMEILIHTTGRKKQTNTSILDAGICHGTAGVAHLYNKIWHYTGDKIFKEACDFWIKKTLDFSVFHDGIGGYKRYNPKEEKFETVPDLLEGASGIGLVLLSYLTNNFSWDYCIMANC